MGSLINYPKNPPPMKACNHKSRDGRHCVKRWGHSGPHQYPKRGVQIPKVTTPGNVLPWHKR